MSFGTLDRSLLTSSLLDSGPVAVAVMALIVAEKDKYGITTLNPRTVAKLFQIPLEEAQKAWDVLTSPDPDSSNKQEQGRRLVPYGEGKWKVVSHEKFQQEHALARKRERDAEAQQRRRDREKAATACCCVCGDVEVAGAVDGKLYCEAHSPVPAPEPEDDDAPF
jgi:hypothetical protein